MRIIIISIALASTAVIAAGCRKAERGGPRVQTYPLTGTVHVDGTPAEHLLVECHPQGDAKIPRVLFGHTDSQGQFTIATYESGDGVPEGEYKLTFKWEKNREIGFGQIDMLGGRYADVNKSEQTVTVKLGEPADAGIIELSSKD